MMLQVNNNSVICPVILSATAPELLELNKFLHYNDVELYFKADVCRFVVLGVRTIKVPKKCLKSFENLFDWVHERVNKELSNIK